MDLRRIIPTDVTASVVAHLSLLALLLLFSEVHPFGAVTAEQVAVEIVTPQEVPPAPVPEKKPEPVPTPTPTPQPDFTLLDKPATPSPAQPAAKSPAAARQQKQAAAPAAAQQQAAASPQPPAAAPAPAFKPPEPDLSIKYQVLLGLPPDLSPPPTPSQVRDSADEGFDAPAAQNADVASSVISAFRRHLRTCSKLPATLARADAVSVKLRVLMTSQGTLASEPILIEASASTKGPLLMQSAISALRACQPYAMLPADRYGEWKVLDLSFTPQDFGGAS